MELWKDIPEFEGLYMVSNMGRVKSMGNNKNRKEKILRGGTNSRGYKTVCLKRKTYQVHQLVAIAFLNHKPAGYAKVIDHKNGNRTDNNLNNLQITTQRENIILSKNTNYAIKEVDGLYNVIIKISKINSKEDALKIRDSLIRIRKTYEE